MLEPMGPWHYAAAALSRVDQHPSSLLLLAFMAEELADAHLLVLGTYRDTELARGHPLRQTLAELIKLPHFQQLSLAGLTEADVAQFIAFVCNVSTTG
jgi:predicted ATPase